MLDTKIRFFLTELNTSYLSIKLSQQNFDKQTNKLSVSRKKISTPLIYCTYNIYVGFPVLSSIEFLITKSYFSPTCMGFDGLNQITYIFCLHVCVDGLRKRVVHINIQYIVYI